MLIESELNFAILVYMYFIFGSTVNLEDIQSAKFSLRPRPHYAGKRNFENENGTNALRRPHMKTEQMFCVHTRAF